jgi:hypothetical protein
MTEVAFSTTNRFGLAVHPHAWYREFREHVVTAEAYILE